MKKLKKYLKKAIRNNPKIVMPTKEQLELIDKISANDPFYWSMFLEIYDYYEEWDSGELELMDSEIEDAKEDEKSYLLGTFFFIDEVEEIAEKLFERYLENFPDHINANYKLARCYDNSGNNRAVEYYKKVLKLDPSHVEAYFSLAQLYARENHYKLALKLYNNLLKMESLEVHHKYQAFLDMGDIYRDTQKAKKAVFYYKKAIKINNRRDDKTRNYFLYIKIGAYSSKKYKIKYFEKATEVRPDRYEAYYHLGSSYLNEKRYKKAISSLKKAIALNKQFPQAEVNLGVAYERLDKDKKAMACYERALKWGKNVFQAYINIFSLYREEHKYPPKEIEKEFIKRFKADKDVYVQYIALMYLLDIYHGKKIDLTVFQKEYKDAGKECCTYKSKIILKNTRKKDKKKVSELMEVLKQYTKVVK